MRPATKAELETALTESSKSCAAYFGFFMGLSLFYGIASSQTMAKAVDGDGLAVPLLQMAVPISPFITLILPVFYVLLHAHLLASLWLLSRNVRAYESRKRVTPNSPASSQEALALQMYPLFLNRAWANVPERPLSRLFLFTTVHLLPILLLLYQLACQIFLHFELSSAAQRICVVVDMALLVTFNRLAGFSRGKKLNRRNLAFYVVGAAATWCLLTVFFCIPGGIGDIWWPWMEEQLDSTDLLQRRVVVKGIRIKSLGNLALVRAKLINCDMTGIDLSGKEMNEADLTDSNLSGANLTDTQLVHAKLRRTRFLKAFLDGTELSAAELDHTQFQEATLTEVKLVHATLNAVSAQGSNWNLSQLEYARIKGCTFTLCDLNGTQFQGAIAVNTKFTGSTWKDCSFAGALLERCDLRGCDLSGGKILGAKLTSSNIDNTNLTILGLKNTESPNTWTVAYQVARDINEKTLRKDSQQDMNKAITLARSRYESNMKNPISEAGKAEVVHGVPEGKEFKDFFPAKLYAPASEFEAGLWFLFQTNTDIKQPWVRRSSRYQKRYAELQAKYALKTAPPAVTPNPAPGVSKGNVKAGK